MPCLLIADNSRFDRIGVVCGTVASYSESSKTPYKIPCKSPYKTSASYRASRATACGPERGDAAERDPGKPGPSHLGWVDPQSGHSLGKLVQNVRNPQNLGTAVLRTNTLPLRLSLRVGVLELRLYIVRELDVIEHPVAEFGCTCRGSAVWWLIQGVQD